MTEIKAIETEYNGYRFRSRLEARWAVFFDAAGIKYEYEPEGFETDDGVRYLPDFYLPDYKAYVEVKPDRPGALEEISKAIYVLFREHTTKCLIILGNIPDKEEYVGQTVSFPVIYHTDAPEWFDWHQLESGWCNFESDPVELVQTRRCPKDSQDQPWDVWLSNGYACILGTNRIGNRVGCGDNIPFSLLGGKKRSEPGEWIHDEVDIPYFTPSYKAFDAARKARFEFGESKRTRKMRRKAG